MDRTEFMSLVYNELHSDGDNCRANRIIDAADEYAEDAAKEKSGDAAFIEWLREKETSIRNRTSNIRSITIADVIDTLIKDYLAQIGGNDGNH